VKSRGLARTGRRHQGRADPSYRQQRNYQQLQAFAGLCEDHRTQGELPRKGAEK
jgi:hypothetical protein